MKFKYFLVPILAIMGCGAVQAQSADTTPSATPESATPQYGHHRHWGHHAWIWKKLNLTDAQKTQIKAIKQSLKSQTKPALLAVLKAKQQLQKDIAANIGQQPQAIQSLVASDVSAVATAESQIAILRATELNQIKTTVLTKEQQTILADFQQKRAARLQDRINKLSQPTT
jgi:Spy/CpxP family protein refolding chaperone